MEFREVDVQTDLESGEESGVRKAPSTLVYASVERTAEFIGIVDRDELEAAIEHAEQQSPDPCNGAPASSEDDEHQPNDQIMNYSRRQFLGALGAGTIATAGLTRSVAAQETPVVRMGNNFFDPNGLHVEPGTTVRFEIAAGTHSATAYESRIPSGASAFDSGVISSGGFEFTFDEPGTYDYYCIPHKSVGMVGRIVVGSPGGPAEKSPIPDGDVPESDAIVDQGAIEYGASGSDGNSDGGMMGHGMGSGPGMMNGWNGGWLGVLPFVGGALGLFGLVGGLLYWAVGRGDAPSESDDSAMETLERRYARGEIREGEFNRRRERLEDGGEGPSQ